MMTMTWMARMRMMQGSQRSNFVDVFPVHTFFCGQTSLWQVLNSLDILFLWLVIVFDGNVLDMKALFGHICSLMSIKPGPDREICQKLQNHNPWLLTSGRLWLSLEIKTLILKQNPGGTNIRSITRHGSLCLRLGQHQGCSGPLVEVLAGPLVEHLVVEALVGQHDPLWWTGRGLGQPLGQGVAADS